MQKTTHIAFTWLVISREEAVWVFFKESLDLVEKAKVNASARIVLDGKAHTSSKWV
jgi:hypothetical protein